MRQPIDQTEIRRLQKAVNEGHEPWRLDPSEVAASALQNLLPRVANRGFTSTQIRKLTVRKAVLSAKSKGNGAEYRLTLERFQWLLPSAKRWEWMIWSPTELAVGCCPPTQDKKK